MIDGGEVGIAAVTINLTDTVQRHCRAHDDDGQRAATMRSPTCRPRRTPSRRFSHQASAARLRTRLPTSSFTAGANSTGHNFGESTGSLSGSVFFDRNGNGAERWQRLAHRIRHSHADGHGRAGRECESHDDHRRRGHVHLQRSARPERHRLYADRDAADRLRERAGECRLRWRHRESGAEPGDRHRSDRPRRTRRDIRSPSWAHRSPAWCIATRTGMARATGASRVSRA